ncbi:MAG TPA: DUF6114 domain-containing protein [Trebonia sp.]|nr:DUF6114 domain-containing protein [Trebonia sp.]
MTADDAGTVHEAGSGPTPAVPAPRHRRPRLARWRSWRRSRPFWGGLLLVLAGLELFAIPLSGVLIHGAIKLVIYIGIGGVFGVLIGALLILSGLMTWFNATHKTFYSIAGIVLGIVSFPASNLGGLFLGMLLAIIGGAIAFAWTPLRETPEPIAVLWTPDEAAPEQTALGWEPDREATEQPDAADEESAKPAGLGPESGAALA